MSQEHQKLARNKCNINLEQGQIGFEGSAIKNPDFQIQELGILFVSSDYLSL